MSALKGFEIPIIGITDGANAYTYSVGADFFDHFENEELRQERFEVKIDLDKQKDMFVLQFEINGSIDTTCDRCMADIKLPIYGSHRLIIKLEDGESDDPDVQRISPEATVIDVDQPIYEYILISLPIVNIYDCDAADPRPCDDEALDTLEKAADKGDSGIWDALKNIDIDN